MQLSLGLFRGGKKTYVAAGGAEWRGGCCDKQHQQTSIN